MRDTGFHPFSGRMSRRFGDSVCRFNLLSERGTTEHSMSSEIRGLCCLYSEDALADLRTSRS